MFWDSIKTEKREATDDINNWTSIYSTENGFDSSSGINESTYFSCLRIVASDISKCPIQVKMEDETGEKLANDHYLFDLLKLRPNEYMNTVDVIKTFITIGKHYGISGLYIDRAAGKVKGLYPVKITNITIDDKGIISSKKNNKVLYDVTSVNNEDFSCFDKDIILFRDFSLDGINYKSTKGLLKQSLDTSIKSQEYLNSLFSNGLTSKLSVQLTSDIKDEKELKKVQDKFDRLYKSNGRVFIMPAGYQVNSLNLSLADSQFAELRTMSRKEIASAMGVPLSKLGESSGNAKSEEQENLAFLVDTLQVIFTQIEQEMDWKLLTPTERKMGYKIRFNINVMLRMDAKTQAEVISTYVTKGIYSLNTAKSVLGIPLLEKDVTTFASGQVTLEQMLSGSLSYTKKAGDSDGN